MRAKRDPKRRAALLSAFVGYLLRTGLTDLSLRPAGRALGTSPRMLLYYFGSKEELLLEAIAQIRSQEQSRFAAEVQRRGLRGSVSEAFEAAWRFYTARRREPYLRLLYELYGLAVANPKRFKRFLDAVAEEYLSMLEQGLASWGLSRRESRRHATLYLATIRGLILDLLGTGDRARVDAAVRELARGLEAELLARQGPGGPPRPYPPLPRKGTAATRRATATAPQSRRP